MTADLSVSTAEPSFWLRLWRAVPIASLFFFAVAAFSLFVYMFLRPGIAIPNLDQQSFDSIKWAFFVALAYSVSLAILWSPSVAFFKEWGKFYFCVAVVILVYVALVLTFVQDWQFSVFGVNKWQVLGSFGVTGMGLAVLVLVRLLVKAFSLRLGPNLLGLFNQFGKKLARISACFSAVVFVVLYFAFVSNDYHLFGAIAAAMLGLVTLTAIGLSVTGLEAGSQMARRLVILLFVVAIAVIQLVLPFSSYTGPATTLISVLLGLMVLVGNTKERNVAPSPNPKPRWTKHIGWYLVKTIKVFLAVAAGLFVGLAIHVGLIWQILPILGLAMAFLIALRVKGVITVNSLAPLIKTRSYWYSVVLGSIVLIVTAYFTSEIYRGFHLLSIIPGALYFGSIVTKNFKYGAHENSDNVKIALSAVQLLCVTLFWVTTYALTPGVFNLIILGAAWLFLLSLDVVLPYIIDNYEFSGQVNSMRSHKYFGRAVLITTIVLATCFLIGSILLIIGQNPWLILPSILAVIAAAFLIIFFSQEMSAELDKWVKGNQVSGVVETYPLELNKLARVDLFDLGNPGKPFKLVAEDLSLIFDMAPDAKSVTITMDDMSSPEDGLTIELRAPVVATNGISSVDWSTLVGGLEYTVEGYRVWMKRLSYSVRSGAKDQFDALVLEVEVRSI